MKACRRFLPALLTTIACIGIFAAPLAQENTLDLVDTLRTHDCAQPLSSTQKLHTNAALDAAAKQVMRGSKIDDALRHGGLQVTRSAVILISGNIDEASLKHTLSNGYCDSIADPKLTAIGIARGANEIVIVLAAPVAPPAALDASKISREVLQLVNEARAESRRCGAQRFAAAPPLALNVKLGAAAEAHAKDMAKYSRLSHQGSDNSKPADRVTRAGYAWQAVGENIAAGQERAKDVVAGWLSSPGHCANIMNPQFTQMGIAYATNAKQGFGIYWAQVFGRPRDADAP